jgi:hypothetical protein
MLGVGALALALTRMVGLAFPRGRQLHLVVIDLWRLLIFHKYEKMLTTFFKISRSWRVISSSRFRRRFSSSNAL